MSILVFTELSDKKVRKSSLEAVCYARNLGGAVTAVALGPAEPGALEDLGKYGVSNVLHASDDRFAQAHLLAVTSAVAAAMEQTGADTLVAAGTSLGTQMSARLSVRLQASLITGVTEVPSAEGFRRPIFTGKAFARVAASAPKRVVTLRKNAAEVSESPVAVAVEPFTPAVMDTDFGVKVISSEKASGDVLLPEAEIVVSGGRGLKGPEHWAMIEDLAKTLGAATGCSKPVSDMGWRPHHEHVGQTGIKVAPSLYIAVGISGAIQHLAGVNASKCIVVINKDPECPFFKAADYGIVGDAFEVVPRLTAALKAS